MVAFYRHHDGGTQGYGAPAPVSVISHRPTAQDNLVSVNCAALDKTWL